MVLDLNPVATTEAVRDDALEWCRAERGSGVLLGLSHEDAWRKIMQQLPLEDRGHIVTTTEVAEPGALMHLLWWAPSVRAVLVDRDEDTDVEEVRRAIELTGSEALLLVDAPPSCGLARLEHDARSADLVVLTAGGGGEDPTSASLLAWSPRLAPALELFDGMHPLTYDILARFNGRPDHGIHAMLA